MIERITRLDDPRVAAYAHVGDPAWMRARGLFVGEGRLVVRRLVEDRRLQVQSILVTPAAAAGMDDVLQAAAEACAVYVCDQEALNAISGFDFHRGCLALAHRPPSAPLEALLAARVLIALEAVGNPDNVGSIFRNALAFGAGGIMLDAASVDPLYRKAIKTSMGAVLRVPFARVDAWPGALQPMRDAGFTIVALTPAPGAEDIEALASSRPEKMVLLFGSEGDGLTAAALDASDRRVRIPIDPRGDSLNVAVAAGIALHRLASPQFRLDGDV